MIKQYLLLTLAVLLASGCLDQSSAPATGFAVMAEGIDSPVVETGDLVSVNYIGRLENGTVFDTSYEETAKQEGLYTPQRPYEPLKFKIGAQQMIQGFEEGVLGMKKGEEKELIIPPEKAYGQVNPDAIISIPLEEFKRNNITPEIGMILQYPGGLVTVINVNKTHSTLDANHMLAGKTLVFTVKVEEIEKE